MNLIVHDEATAELTAAAEWYEHERVGLGDELLAEAAGALKAIAQSPAAWSFVMRSKVVRRYVFERFPYIAYFVVRADHVLVLAFGHTSRKPGYWRHRLK